MKKSIPYILIALLIGYIVFMQRKHHAERIAVNKTISVLYGKMNTYVDQYNRVVVSKKSVEMQRAKFKFLSDSLQGIIHSYKKPKNVIIYKYVVKTDTVVVKPDTVYVDQKRLFHFTNNDGFNKVSGTVFPNEVKLDPLVISNEIDIVTGPKKQGFLKKKLYTIDIVNSNPYIQTRGVTHFVVVPKKSWHERWYIMLPLGIAAGMLIR